MSNNYYTVTWEGTWRPLTMAQMRTTERDTAPTQTKLFTTTTPTQAQTYAYVKYYAEHNGMLDIKLISEGFQNEEKPQQPKSSKISKKATRKKSRKKR